MLKPLPRPKTRRRKIIAYDCEWLPGTLEIRLVGVWDGMGYRAYHSVTDFLDNELTKKNTGKWFYAHAGGLTDIQFILEMLIEDDRYQVDASFSNSSAIIVRIRRGHMSWTFLDSLWTLPVKLASIGDYLKMPKGEVAWDAPLPILEEYNRQDCKILYTALDQFQDTILALGSELRMTLASTSLRLFRRKYLKRNISTSKNLNQLLRPAYIGGRVEVFYRKEHSGYYYDINSCYPDAMTNPLPGQYMRTRRSLPTDDCLYIAHIQIRVPEMNLGPLPMIREGGVFFPTGTLDGWFCQPEIELAESLGCVVEKIFECLHYKPFSDLRGFATDLYNRRKRSRGFLHQVYKTLLNAGYGKFGEKADKMRLLIRPNKDAFNKAVNKKRYGKGDLDMVSPGVWLVSEQREVEHAHVPIAAFVTSLGRANLYGHMNQCENVYYCDTDGFACDIPDLPISTDLGMLKLEKTYERAYFHSPKLYYLESASGLDVKAKGFPKLSYEQFQKLISGDYIARPRMLRLRELYSKGRQAPMVEIQHKRLTGKARPKRVFSEDGTSRPWTMEELDRKWN